MLSRKPQENPPTPFPRSWEEKTEKALFSLHRKFCEREKKSFQVYGFLYPDEIFLSTSYLDQKNLALLPITYMASMDHEQKGPLKKNFDFLVDSVGLFFDSFFSQEDWDGYTSSWSKSSLKNRPFYYRVTREVISLTLEADKILSQNL